MPWRRTLDANGNPILRDTETGEERPVERVAPESVAAQATSPPIQTAPSDDSMTRGEGFGVGLGALGNLLGSVLSGQLRPGPALGEAGVQGVERWLGEPADVRAVGARAQPETGAAIGAAIPSNAPGLDFGDSTALRPADQALMDEIRSILGTGVDEPEAGPEPDAALGATSPGDRAAADLDSATAFMSLGLPDPAQGDPGLARLAEVARERESRFAPILERELARATEQRDLVSEDNPRRDWLFNTLMFGGRLLGGERGNIAGRMIQERSAAEDAWTDRIIQLTEAGASMEDAIARADAAILSNQYQTGVGLEERDYSRGMAERQFGLQERQVEAQQTQADRQLRLMLAEILSQGLQRTEESNLAAAGTLLESPMAGEASRFIAQSQIPGASPETQATLAGTLSQRARLAPVIERVLAGVSRGDVRDIRREATRAARAQGIELTPADLALIERTIVQSRVGAPSE